MSTAWPDVRGRVCSSASLRRRPRAPLLALAAEVEERVVDADRHPDQQDHRLRSRRRPRPRGWRARTRPIVASTPEKASSTGRPAATSAPNATSRMISVTGSDEYSARWKSLLSVSLSSWFALAKPNSATVKPSCAVLHGRRRRRAPAGPSRRPCPGRPRSRTGRAPSGRSLEIWPALPGASGERTFCTSGSAETVRTTSATAARNARIGQRRRLRLDEHALARAVREAGVASGSARAVFVSPAAVSVSFSIFVPATDPERDCRRRRRRARPETAVFQWPALQRPARARR